jgi:hypothetical protein
MLDRGDYWQCPGYVVGVGVRPEHIRTPEARPT